MYVRWASRPSSGCSPSSRSIRGIAEATDSHCLFHGRLIRTPMRNATVPGGASAVIRLASAVLLMGSSCGVPSRVPGELMWTLTTWTVQHLRWTLSTWRSRRLGAGTTTTATSAPRSSTPRSSRPAAAVRTPSCCVTLRAAPGCRTTPPTVTSPTGRTCSPRSPSAAWPSSSGGCARGWPPCPTATAPTWRPRGCARWAASTCTSPSPNPACSPPPSPAAARKRVRPRLTDPTACSAPRSTTWSRRACCPPSAVPAPTSPAGRRCTGSRCSACRGRCGSSRTLSARRSWMACSTGWRGDCSRRGGGRRRGGGGHPPRVAPRASPRAGQAVEADPLVHPFVVADLTENVGEGLVPAVLRRGQGKERRGGPLRVLGNALGVLVLRVVFDVGVEPVGPGRPQHAHQPEHLVDGEGDQLREEPEAEPALPPSLRGLQLVQDQRVPLLVVLLRPVLLDGVVQLPGTCAALSQLPGEVVGSLFPGLVGDAVDDLQGPELRHAPARTEDDVLEPEQQPGRDAIPEPGRVEGFVLPLSALRGAQESHGAVPAGSEGCGLRHGRPPSGWIRGRATAEPGAVAVMRRSAGDGPPPRISRPGDRRTG